MSSFVACSSSSVLPTAVVFAPAAFAKLSDGLTVEVASPTEDPEAGAVEAAVEAAVDKALVGPRSVACRELVRDIECWGARSLASSKRAVISRSLVELSTGLQRIEMMSLNLWG